MFYLILAIISSALVSVVMRISQRFTRNGMTLLASNYVMCTAAAAFLAGSPIPTGEGSGLTILMGCISGVLYLLGFVLLQYNIRRGGVVLPATFQKLGVLVPTIAAITIFGETPRATQLLGVGIAIGAILFMQGRTGKAEMSNLLGLLASLLCGGVCDVMSKVFETWGNPAHGDCFLVFTFLVATALSIGVCVAKKQSVTLPDVLWGLALGVPNYMSARFLLWALKEVPAVVVYPTFSVGTIIAVTVVGVLAFREKVGKRKLIALGMILGALVLLNV